MKKQVFKYIAFFLIVLVLGVIIYQYLLHAENLSFERESEPQVPTEEQVQASLNNLPLVFQENLGQSDDEVLYLAKSGGNTIFVTATEIVYAMKQGVLRQSHVSSRTVSVIDPSEKQQFKSNYFIGNDPDKWQSDVSSYAEISLRSLYEGVNLTLSGGRAGLSYVYDLEPGVDPNLIEIKFQGGEDIVINPDGTLVVITDFGNFGLRAPIITQEIEGRTVSKSGGYRLLGQESVGFEVSGVDKSASLRVSL